MYSNRYFFNRKFVVIRKIHNFADKYNVKGMGMTTKKMTREEALKRWNEAKATKKAMVEKMQKVLYEEYKARTGEEPLQFNVW